jgi:hypothetical protein
MAELDSLAARLDRKCAPADNHFTFTGRREHGRSCAPGADSDPDAATDFVWAQSTNPPEIVLTRKNGTPSVVNSGG